ncbi:hypothetical protein Har1130_07195 [Haloarcula sp. CBA1130]|uniref:hypothetical protein n=1 Tax=unclassified Haloarcula TaxID=2624677 RepID=UPI0012455D9D|nr:MULTISPECIES: hypothetical protein [unclassified Haloarcula]KAA9397780.1 hypothetical protein Har1129_05945 [Haloarcula sp. CBA1129]KAA9402533.1 hypothetical protein Har1130_07195 [Haloarcula sp. CBA1130]
MSRESALQEVDPMELLESLSDEPHTGENRCWPCTVLNLGLVGLGAFFLRARGRSLASLLIAVVGVAVVYLRGYLVPYTPKFAPRLVAASPVPNGWFHGEQSHKDTVREDATRRESESLADDVGIDGDTVFRELSAAGVIEVEGEQLFLAAAVDTAWHERMDELADYSLDTLAATLQASLPRIDYAEPYADDADWVALGSDNKQLLPRPVVVSELAAYEVLGERLDDERLRVAGAEALRMFLDRCPVCGSELVESSSVSCCGGHLGPRQNPDETLVCPTCEQRLYTFEVSDN